MPFWQCLSPEQQLRPGKKVAQPREYTARFDLAVEVAEIRGFLNVGIIFSTDRVGQQPVIWPWAPNAKCLGIRIAFLLADVSATLSHG